MKMNIGLFFGILLICIGLLYILKVAFNLQFPVFRAVFALLLIFIGLRLILNRPFFSFSENEKSNILFNEVNIKGNPKTSDYNVLFGKGVFDFRDIDLTGGTVKIKISTLFGGTEILVSGDTPLRIKAESLFGGAELPEGNTAAFGTAEYKSKSYNKDKSHLYIKTEVLFGGVKVIKF